MSENQNTKVPQNIEKPQISKKIRPNNLTAKPIENKPNPQDEHINYTKFGDWSINGHTIDF